MALLPTPKRKIKPQTSKPQPEESRNLLASALASFPSIGEIVQNVISGNVGGNASRQAKWRGGLVTDKKWHTQHEATGPEGQVSFTHTGYADNSRAFGSLEVGVRQGDTEMPFENRHSDEDNVVEAEFDTK